MMRRTAKRPLPAGRMTRESALHFGVGLACFSVLLMGLAVNYVANKGESGARDAGKLRAEGKEYVVQDGDVMLFRFNV